MALLLVGYTAALAGEAWRLSTTADETSHLAASYMYWNGEDILYPSDAPPLTRILCGWIPKVLSAPLRRTTLNAYEMGVDTLRAMGAAPARRLLFLMRLPFLVFPVLTVFLVWSWGRRMFQEETALWLAAAAALEPTLAGHGPLLNSDAPAAFGCLLFCYAAWFYCRQPSGRRLAAMIGALTLGALIKLTLLALIPVAMALAIWKGPRVSGMLIPPAAVYVALVAAYQFRFAPVPQLPVEEAPYSAQGLPQRIVERTLDLIPFPAQFARGVRVIGRASDAGFPNAYMLGGFPDGPEPWYFPLTLAVKFPIPLQIAALAGLAACFLSPFRIEKGILWGVASYLFLLIMQSQILLGIRHVLPVLPLLVMSAGFALERWRGRAAPAVLLLWLAVSAGRVYPNGISFFNEWAGGSENGWKYLSGSNVDWGQNMGDLGDYVRRNRILRIRGALFCPDPIEFHFAPGVLVWIPEPRHGTAAQYEPAPGVYAISVNYLTGIIFIPAYRDYFAIFRNLRPDARVGHSILIYRIGAGAP